MNPINHQNMLVFEGIIQKTADLLRLPLVKVIWRAMALKWIELETFHCQVRLAGTYLLILLVELT